MNKIEQKLDSREVAQMMEVKHGHLLEKIDGINKDFGSRKIGYEKYWIEGTFKNRGKPYRNFLITERGCEFLAHKTTGTKGNLFTDRYMDRFEQMKELTNNPLGVLNLQQNTLQLAEGMQLMGQVVQGIQNAMVNMQTIVADSINSKDLQIDKTMELIGIRDINTKRLAGLLKEKLSRKYGYSVKAGEDVYIQAKKKVFKNFNVGKWEDISAGNFNRVHAYIDALDED